MIFVGIVRIERHRPFGSWLALVASAIMAGFYANRIARRWSQRAAPSKDSLSSE